MCGWSVAVGLMPAGLSGRFVVEIRPERIRGNVGPTLIASVEFRVPGNTSSTRFSQPLGVVLTPGVAVSM